MLEGWLARWGTQHLEKSSRKFVDERRIGEISSVKFHPVVKGNCGGEVFCSQGCVVRGEISSEYKKQKLKY